NSDSERWQNSHLNADKIITKSEDGGLTLEAANLKAKRWEADLQNLTLTSRQDTEKYESKQTSAGASGSIAYGSGGGASVNAAYSKASVDYAQVKEQTGIQVGEEGMNATIHNHTQLNGAIIESEASQEENRFKTGSISHTDIENRSEIKTESASISAGSKGINPMQAISSALSLLGNRHEKERSTTQSAISENIRIDTKTPENLTALSRDTKHANQQVDKQDLQKVQERQEMAKVIGEISNNAISIATYEEREKINKLGLEKFKLEEQYGKNHPQAQQLGEQINQIQENIDRTYGIGSPNGMAIRAVTAALQAAAQNDTNGAVVALASPYLNKQIHDMTKENTAKDKATNLIAHALLSAVEFQVTGKDPLTGAVAGVTGEATATILTKALYDKTPDQLTASEKENISTLSQVAGGLAASLTAKANGTTDQQGGTFISATAGAETAKRAVENNFLLNKYSEKKLNAEEKALFDKLKAYGVEDVDKYQEAFNKAETPEERDKIIAQYRAAEHRGSEIVLEMYKSGELTEQEYHLLKTSFINQKMLDGAKDGQIANKGQSKAGFLETSPYGYYGHRLTTMGALQDVYLVEAEKVFADRQVSSGRMTPEERETYLQRLDISSQMASPLTPDMLKNMFDNPTETVINWAVGKVIGKAMSGTKAAPFSTTKKVDDVSQLGVNNPNYNKELNERVNDRAVNLRTERTQQRVNEIAHQFNAKSIEPKDMKIAINGQTYTANPKTSMGAPVYQGVSDQNVFSYFKEITGVDKLPNPIVISKMKDLNGNNGKVWSVKPTEGPLKGSTVNLRTFSSSQEKTRAKYTVEIVQPSNVNERVSGINAGKIEIKFEK
ncbi:VENN motif pre-toxin domain-containing protein, partial [Rodentibacter trehalosifermentans]|uniref:VENN motif pre-toxin domain-containing protein n=2 Tax=Rodentibacter trehalosifermentans TaxID=1908263 RepID=UPI002117FD6D